MKAQNAYEGQRVIPLAAEGAPHEVSKAVKMEEGKEVGGEDGVKINITRGSLKFELEEECVQRMTTYKDCKQSKEVTC